MLGEADYGLTDMALGGQNARYNDDDKLLVRFFKHPKLNEGKTASEGRPIFEELDYISIMQPGNKDSIIMRPATQIDKQRFAEHFRKYEVREGDYEALEGTLLESWPGITRAMAEQLKYLNIRTVEQLANVADSNAQKMMGIQMLKAKAKAYLEASANEAAAEALTAANDKIDQQNQTISDLAAKLEQVQAKLDSLEIIED